MKADLHIHTYFSDGTLSPQEVLERAKSKGVELIAITDHNQIKAWEGLTELAESFQIKVLKGVEINFKHKGKEFHLLAYAFKDTPELLSLIQQADFEMKQMSVDLIEKLIPLYPQLSKEDYASYEYDPKQGGWKGLHYLLDRGVTQKLFDGFKFYKAYGCDYKDYNFPAIEVLCEAIHKAGGKAILAHPGEYYKDLSKEALIQELEHLKEAGIDGIECYYPTHSEALRETCINFCRAEGLIITAGSDEHGEFGKQAKSIQQTIGCLDIDLAKDALKGLY